MKINNIENFVNYDSSKHFTLRSVKSLAFVFLFIDLATNVPAAWVIGGKVLLVCLILDTITLAYIIFTIFLSHVVNKRTHPVTMSDNFLLSGIVSTFFYIHFYIFSIWEIVKQGFDMMYYSLSIILPVLFFVLYFIIILFTIRNDSYNEKAQSKKILKRGNLAAFASLGAVAGMMLARIFLSGLDELSSGIIVYCCTLLCACLWTMGFINFIKYYYIKKYSIEDRVQITLKELKRMKD
jgi:hypothetical protein